MNRYLRTRLSVMMFFFYSSLGAWAVTSSTFLKTSPAEGGLGFSNTQVGWIYCTFAIGGLLAHPLVGLLVDRLFRADRVFSFGSIIAGTLLLGASQWCELRQPILASAEGDRVALTTETFQILFAIMLAYSFFLQLATPLLTLLCMRNLPDPTRQFVLTRLWGTVGWVVIGLLLALLVVPLSPQPFLLAGVLKLIVGVYGFTLPSTPPKGTGKSLAESVGLPALALLKKRSFAVFLFCAFVLSMLNQFYGVHGHRYLTERCFQKPEQWMTIGQVVEVLCLLTIPLLNPKQYLKGIMVLGILGGILRGVILATGPDWLVLCVAVPMHGWHFAFFFIIAANYIDREAPPHLRGSTQAIWAFVSAGLAPLAGNMLAAQVLDVTRTEAGTNWTAFWYWSTGGCVAVLGIFLLYFRIPASVQNIEVIRPAQPSRQCAEAIPVQRT